MFAAVLFLPHAARGLPASDDTPPIVSYSIDGIAGTNDWFRGSTHGNNITVRWSVSDHESPIISTTGCDPAIQIPGPVPAPGTTRTCTAVSDGGTTSITTRFLKIDADPPTTTAAPSRPPNSARLVPRPLSVSWRGVDPTSGISLLPRARLPTTGRDTAGSTRRAAARTTPATAPPTASLVRYDTVAPDDGGDAEPRANGAGWYRRPLSISLGGSDTEAPGSPLQRHAHYSGPDTSGTTETAAARTTPATAPRTRSSVSYDTWTPTPSRPQRAPNARAGTGARISSGRQPTPLRASLLRARRHLQRSGHDGTTVSGSCTDSAGNSSPDSSPSSTTRTHRPPWRRRAGRPTAGWFKRPLSVSWSGVRPDLRDRLLQRAAPY
jgi:hypothetical protein